MLKIVYPICCGIDVHKTFVVACIAITDNKGITTYKRRSSAAQKLLYPMIPALSITFFHFF